MWWADILAIALAIYICSQWRITLLKRGDPQRMRRHWSRLPKEVLNTASPIHTCWGCSAPVWMWSWAAWWVVPLIMARWSLRTPPTQAVLLFCVCFYDSMILQAIVTWEEKLNYFEMFRLFGQLESSVLDMLSFCCSKDASIAIKAHIYVCNCLPSLVTSISYYNLCSKVCLLPSYHALKFLYPFMVGGFALY